MDRSIALENAKYVFNNIEDLSGEIEFKKDGIIVKRAHQVLEETVQFMETIDQIGLMPAIEQGHFADIKRPRDMGKGLDGLVKKGPEYYNPFDSYLKNELGLNA
jgi:beta-lysine 5,6-aminomutase alpha subunit